MDDTAIKPLKFERLFDWALVTSVIPTHDKTRTMQCVHKPASHLLSTTNSLTKVGIRLFGFLGKHNFTAIGNWDRYAFPIRTWTFDPFLSDLCTHGNIFTAQNRERGPKSDHVFYSGTRSIPRTTRPTETSTRRPEENGV